MGAAIVDGYLGCSADGADVLRIHTVLTGGIASGKSTVSRLFAALGVSVIDSDEIAREVVAPGTPGPPLSPRASAPACCNPMAASTGDACARSYSGFPRRAPRPGGDHPPGDSRGDGPALGAGRRRLPDPGDPAAGRGVARGAGSIAMLVVDRRRGPAGASRHGPRWVDRGTGPRGCWRPRRAVQRRAAADDVIVNDGDLASSGTRSRCCTSAPPRRGAQDRQMAHNSGMSSDPVDGGAPASARRRGRPDHLRAAAQRGMRSFLRVDFLYNQAGFHHQSPSHWGSRARRCRACSTSRDHHPRGHPRRRAQEPSARCRC